MTTFEKACETFAVSGGDLRQFWSDARAGMVPEGELAGIKTEALDHWNAFCDESERRVKAEAELAKAWEAGRDAAWRAMATCNDKTHAEELRAISKLQPPRGKHV